ncbi:hypothetical protein HYY75_10540 [bacterium]|nr:hypothetical protein [bacterium]
MTFLGDFQSFPCKIKLRSYRWRLFGIIGSLGLPIFFCSVILGLDLKENPSVISAQEFELVFIPEMAPMEEEPSGKTRQISDISFRFQNAWERISDSVSSIITPKKVKDISRRAKSKMAGFSLPFNWIRKIPMKPLWIEKKTGFFVFGQEVIEGLELPSHSPIVFRRLIVRAFFDPKNQSIGKIQISIRGWREE